MELSEDGRCGEKGAMVASARPSATSQRIQEIAAEDRSKSELMAEERACGPGAEAPTPAIAIQAARGGS